MTVNLSMLENLGRTAVRCISEEQAEMFMDAMWEQYPKLVSGIWRKGETNWERYRDIGCIYYLPRIVCERGEVSHCQSSTLSSRERGKYKVVEFEELLQTDDLGEFSKSNMDIEMLFSMR